MSSNISPRSSPASAQRLVTPDFAIVTVQFVPNLTCVELKSLKLYFQSFRNEGIFYEAVTNQIADDLTAVMQPRWMLIQTDWTGRGGIRSVIRVESGALPGGAPLDEGYDDDDDFDPPEPGRPPGF